MAQTNSYPIRNGSTSKSIAIELSEYLKSSENMETQVLTAEDGTVIVQGRIIGGKWKQLIGMDKSITVKLNDANNIISAEIGAGKWIDKGAVLTASMFILWPLAITSALGIFLQTQLPQKIFTFIQNAVS